MKIWLSIIIPVYNGEKYVKRAVESILCQDMNGIEIIIIDDGSTDNTYAICEQFAIEYEMIKLIHSENEGVSHARNLGIRKAKGEWITFIDADDYYLESSIAKMKKNVSSRDNVIIFNYCKDTTVIQERTYKRIKLKSEDAINVLLDFTKYGNLLPCNMKKNHSVFTSCWAKLYKKLVIDANGIKFQEKLTLSEDMCFNLAYFNMVSDVSVVDCEIYNYSTNFESVTHSFSEKKLLGRQQLIYYLRQVKNLPKECEMAKHKYIILTAMQLAEKIGIANNTNLTKEYIILLKQRCITECISNKLDRCFSAGKKQNSYLNVQYWLLCHKMYDAILLVGYIYAKIRG